MRAAVASVWAVIIAIFFVQLANGLQTSLLSYRAVLEAFPDWTTGIIMASYYVGYSLAPLASRTVIGRAGHVNAMWVGAMCAALVIAAHALLVVPIAWSVLRLISGFVLSSLYIGAESWIHDRVANDMRGRVFSIYMVVQMIAMTIAQGLFSLEDPRGVVPFLLAAALFLVGAVPVVIARHTAPRRAPPEPLDILKLFAISPLGAVTTVLAGVSWSIVFTFGPVYARHSGFDQNQTGVFMAFAMMGGALVQFPMGWFSDRAGRRRTLALLSAGGIAVSLFGLWADGQGALLEYVGAALTGALVFPIYAISAAHTNDAVEPGNRVAAAAGLILLFGLGSILGPLLCGGAATAMGSRGFYTVLAVTLSLSLAAAATTR
ncbi:MAG: MFS transporter [Rhizomicrobium sp.]